MRRNAKTLIREGKMKRKYISSGGGGGGGELELT